MNAMDPNAMNMGMMNNMMMGNMGNSQMMNMGNMGGGNTMMMMNNMGNPMMMNMNMGNPMMMNMGNMGNTMMMNNMGNPMMMNMNMANPMMNMNMNMNMPNQMMNMPGMNNNTPVNIDDAGGWNLIFENQNDRQSFNIRISEQKLVKEAISLYYLKSNKSDKCKFIFNNKELFPEMKICQSGLTNMSKILVISIQNLKGAN